MKKSTRNNITEAVLTLAILAGLLFVLAHITESKNSYGKYNEFYKYADEYDVLFCGSSHMMNSVLPMELWKQYGIRSYNIANGAESIPVTYHVLKNALDHSSPKVVVLDVFYAYSNQLVPENSKELPHQFFDMLPLSRHKTEAIFELFKDNRERWNYLYDFSIYHYRWSELTAGDIIPDDECFGGARTALDSYLPGDHVFNPPDIHDMAPVPKKYLKKIKEMCDGRGIRLICVVNPYAMWQENRNGNVDYVKEASDLNLEFIDLRNAGIVDMSADCADRMHLNIGGQRKITEYYGKLLSEADPSLCRQSTPVDAGPGVDPYPDSEPAPSDGASDRTWNERYEAYFDKKAGLLSECTEYTQLLTDLNDPDLEWDIRLKQGFSGNECANNMLENAKTYENVRITTDDAADADIKIYIKRVGSDGYLLEKSFDL